MADLLLSIDRYIATITLNRPAQRNAINYEMWCQLPDLCSRLETNPQVRVIVFRGAGDEAFSAGGDIREFETRRRDPWQAKIYNGKVEMALATILRMTKPTIALVKGYCVGGGCELAVHCDLRLAADNAIFGMPVAKLNTLIGYGEMQRFVEIIGVGHTSDLLLTARLIDAQAALRMGLCSQIHPLATVDAALDELTAQMVDLAPLAQRWHKQMLQTLVHKPDLLDLTPDEAMLPDEIFNTDDYAEGVRAFLEKRKPNFRGR